jgi:2-polyprenyl-6-hydroxyphenyl methylase/3-demethylubiquinone-9 3-methyltransferase
MTLRQPSSARDRFYAQYWSSAQSDDDDPTTELRRRWLLECLREHAQGARPRRILDAGCGSGEFAAFLRKSGFEVTAIDLSSDVIAAASAAHPGIRFLVGSLEDRLDLADGEFDAIWHTEVLEHLFDVHACLSELNRVLRQGGLLLLTTPYHGWLKNLVIACTRFEEHFNPYLSHVRFFTRRSLSACLVRAGFEPVHWRGLGRVWLLYRSFFVVARKIGVPLPAPEIVG